MPNPIARYGIPPEADSITNPRCIGTYAHEQFWNEQIDRCINGYMTGGIFIPGRYYYYLNFCMIGTLERGYHYPEFIDVDLEFFNFIEDIKRAKRGGIFLKGRRRGISEKIAKGIFDHGMRFSMTMYKCGICAGLEVYSLGFHSKTNENNANLPPELRIHYALNDFDKTEAGWTEKTPQGHVKMGDRNIMFGRTMKTNPNMFKGEALSDCYFEEAGEFSFLLKGYSATKACFQVGDDMIGTPLIGGTGGKITSSSAEFKEIWGDANTYKLDRFSLYGDRMLIGFFIGSKNSAGVVNENCPNIRKMQKELNLEEEQIMGCEDVEAARERILTRRKELLQGKNRELYYEYFLDNPLNQNESFLKFSGNNFDPEAITDQRMFLNDRPAFFKEYILDWVKNQDGQVIIPRQVTMTPFEAAIHANREEEIVWIYQGPEPNYRNLDIVAIDSYDQDKSYTSKSLGAIVVIRRRGHNLKSIHTGEPCPEIRIPVLLYRNRPRRKEIFYEIGMKVSVLYNTIDNTLIDAAKPAIIQAYKDSGLTKFLSGRPKSFESDGSQQSHDYGVLLTATDEGRRGSKPQMVSLLQSYVLDELKECVFPHIVEGFSEYDVLQKDSDWDEIDATGIGLMKDVDLKLKPRRSDEQEDLRRFQAAEWGYQGGTLVRVDKYNPETEDGVESRIKDPFMRMIRAGAFDDSEDQDVDPIHD